MSEDTLINIKNDMIAAIQGNPKDGVDAMAVRQLRLYPGPEGQTLADQINDFVSTRNMIRQFWGFVGPDQEDEKPREMIWEDLLVPEPAVTLEESLKDAVRKVRRLLELADQREYQAEANAYRHVLKILNVPEKEPERVQMIHGFQGWKPFGADDGTKLPQEGLIYTVKSRKGHAASWITLEEFPTYQFLASRFVTVNGKDV